MSKEKGEEMDKNRRLLGLDCKGERRKKGSKPFGQKGKGINWIFDITKTASVLVVIML
jgi:hypothetical protein